MKTWTLPVASAQRFAANDFVSSCGYEIMCDIETPEGIPYLQIPGGFDWDQDGVNDFHGNMYASACGTMHVVAKSTQFYEYTFYKGGPNHNVNGLVTLDAPITAAYWVELDENGNAVNAHFTDPKNIQNMVESSKS